MKQLKSELLQAEHNLEIETKRRKEVEGLLEAERLQQAGDLSGAREEAKHVQERTQRILDQVAWQGDACRLQLAQEQIKAQTCEELSNSLAKEVSAYKRQLEDSKAKCELLQSATSQLRLHQVRLREHRLQIVKMDERQIILSRTCTRWKTEYLNARRCVQSARILTAMCEQRHKLSRHEKTNPIAFAGICAVYFIRDLTHQEGLMVLAFTGHGTAILAKMRLRGERPGFAPPQILFCPAKTKH